MSTEELRDILGEQFDRASEKTLKEILSYYDLALDRYKEELVEFMFEAWANDQGTDDPYNFDEE